jgi:hypothetical protein
MSAVVVENLPKNIHMPGRAEAVKLLQLKGFKLADPDFKDSFTDVCILIGADQYYNFVYGQPVVDNLQVIPSKLGGLISGVLPYTNKTNYNVAVEAVTVLRIQTRGDSDCLSGQLERLWSMDSTGINYPCENFNDNLAMTMFKNSIRFENNKYVASLPWKPSHPPLSSNFNLAKSRLRSNLHNLRKNPRLLQQYDDVIKDQLTREFIEKVDDLKYDGKVHYLSHHGIKKDSKTTPLRVVFDCSAKCSPAHPSLNYCLYAGPPVLNDLASVLLKFRLHNFVCISDIAKAYLMIGLNEDDIDCTRFLWPEDPSHLKSIVI